MALVFRVSFFARGLRVCAPKCNSLKINLKSLTHSQNECGYKALFNSSTTASRREYSTVSDAERKTTVKRKDNEGMPLAKTADGKDIVQDGMLSIKVRNIKFFSLSTSFLAIGCQPLIYMKAVMNGTANSWTIPTFAVFAAFAVATPILLHYVTKRYITQVCYDPVKDVYTATSYNIFVFEKKIEFTPKDVTIPTILGMFTTCAIKGKPVFLDAEDFHDQSHYVKIMGYDKPLDLQTKGTRTKKPKLKKQEDSLNDV